MKKLIKIFVIIVVFILIPVVLYLLTKNTAIKDTEHANTTGSKVQPQEIVNLNNGDTYLINAKFIEKELNGNKVRMLGYNGSIPGPLIKVKQGSEIILELKNELDVPTTLHSHGVRLENKYDGVPKVTQEEIKPGETFSYKVKFPDQGLFWYHPHIREDYTQEMGLYGNFLVEPNNKEEWNPVNSEKILFVDDISLTLNGIETFDNETANYVLMGRFGNTLLVNGDTKYSDNVNFGDVVRYYASNSANTRVFNLSIQGARIKLVGSDNGKYEKEEFVESIILGPSERVIFEVYFDKPGNYTLLHNTPEKEYILGVISVSDKVTDANYSKEFFEIKYNKELTDYRTNLSNYINIAPDKSVEISLEMKSASGMMGGEGMHMMPDGSLMGNNTMNSVQTYGKIEWEDTMPMMNAASTTKTVKWELIDTITEKTNHDINWTFSKDELIKLRIFNSDKSQHPMQHPFHIHGQRFIVLATNGEPTSNLAWKDSALIQTGDTVDLLVEMTNPGTWMFHCHIPEHLESGMMGNFQVL